MKTLKTLFATFVLLGAAMTTTTAAFGQTGTTINVANPTSGNGYTVENGVITINANGTYTLQGSTASNRVVVAEGVSAMVTLDNVSITSATASPLELSSGGEGNGSGANVTLMLVGDNFLSSTVPDTEGEDRFSAALQVEGSASVTILGSGLLTTTGGIGAAGIGSGLIEHVDGSTVSFTTGTINIAGGFINTTGGYFGAGIGGGYGGNGGNINIAGGVILAISLGGMGDPAGIGGGNMGNAGNISITGGSVFAWGASGEGIGSGANSSDGSVNISGGTIVADEIGIGTVNSNTSVAVSGGVIIAGSINTSSFGNAAVITGANVTESLVRTMFANTPKESAEGAVTIEVHDTITIPGSGGTDTIVRHDTIRLPDDTITQHDTVRVEIPGPTQHDTLRITLHDTLTQTVRDTFVEIRKVPVHDTIFSKIYVVVDNATGAEYVVDATPLALIPAGEDRYYLQGLAADQPIAIYDLRGALILRTDRMPVRLPARGVFIVGQSGRYYKFVR